LTARTSIESDTKIGIVRLTVSDLDRSRVFYEQALGMRPTASQHGSLSLGTGEGEPLLELRGDPGALSLDRRATGLYHLAVLLPTRTDLAKSLRRVAACRWPLDGASDHLVSEALYLSDPDGNGIELYRDRPRQEWPRSGGQLEMATMPLDLHDLLAELRVDDREQPAVPAGTQIGHVHLQVSDLREAEWFYSGVLGFDVTVRGYPGALFVSAGGYHHHIGLNTWHSAGANPPAPGSVGLSSFEIRLPDRSALEAALVRVRTAGIEPEDADGGPLVRDPSGNGIRLTAS
jgi:catechol 2,3-dioxygenase